MQIGNWRNAANASQCGTYMQITVSRTHQKIIWTKKKTAENGVQFEGNFVTQISTIRQHRITPKTYNRHKKRNFQLKFSTN